jgi:hypothetical protein
MVTAVLLMTLILAALGYLLLGDLRMTLVPQRKSFPLSLSRLPAGERGVDGTAGRCYFKLTW